MIGCSKKICKRQRTYEAEECLLTDYSNGCDVCGDLPCKQVVIPGPVSCNTYFCQERELPIGPYTVAVPILGGKDLSCVLHFISSFYHFSFLIAFSGTLLLALVIILCLKKRNSAQPNLPVNNLGNAAVQAEEGHALAQVYANANEDNANDGLEPVDLADELNEEPQDDGLEGN